MRVLVLQMYELFFKGQNFKQLQTWVSVSQHFLIEREEETEGRSASVTSGPQNNKLWPTSSQLSFFIIINIIFFIAVLHLRCGVGFSLLAASRGYSLGAVCRLSLVVERGF